MTGGPVPGEMCNEMGDRGKRPRVKGAGEQELELN